MLALIFHVIVLIVFSGGICRGYPVNVHRVLSRKPLDHGVFRLPRLDEVLRKGITPVIKNNETNVRHRRIGATDLFISEVGLGTMTFGRYVEERTAHELLDHAVGHGINLIDTSDCGELPIISGWLRKQGVNCRAKLVLATKVSKNSQVLKEVEASLSCLNVDYIDLLQLEDGDDIEEVLDTLRTLLATGKIRYWGLLNVTPWRLLRYSQLANQCGIPIPVTVQLTYNLLSRNDVEKGFVELSRPQNNGINIIANGALAGGVLTGKYLEYLDPTTSGRLLRYPSYMSRYRGSLAARAVRDYYDIAIGHGFPNLCVMSLRWVFTRPFILSTLIGVSDLYQLRENLACLDPSLVITEAVEREINQIHWKWRDPIRILE
ncbi:Aldo-keto reductase [Babesia sp. Xinjiang]|uniref:Aldo-keto reductase n=1 Tax=Babesia sp. Xinjiang TaxID=462227 RepID=UPI000A22C248|nr:Aldo-keto reductase [Babesia sp. Xinjiang]ORM40180.1 Aldo-keto reductase [Babesia sp. Xinjiang]